ncbi:FeoA family protein [Anaerotalea alkaliphila]|uniref:Ferrous iron transport protein A n=1 Tax=Anaerotalea alkaliphila TaxID=2662126 RepID=A0A7X5HTP0_9FIRM|nr:FeoA family protein [Anaerotalea alkaliphila]NDL66463.1 ferrous iron transport protein A [Anaerotalea alkaliphila]
MPLTKSKAGHTGVVKSITATEKIQKFLFSLGCSEGQEITLVSILAGNYIISVGDGRYAIDKKMAGAIELA